MLVRAVQDILGFLGDIEEDYEDDIKGDNPKAFTRTRKLTPLPLLLQMFGQKGKTQQAELMDFYKDLGEPLDITKVGFFQSRMKFNDAAVRLMCNDFTTDMYEKYDKALVKLNGYLVTAIDGSKCIFPSTSENEELFGRFTPKGAQPENSPVMGMISTIYDCVNKIVLDILVDGYKGSERELASRHLTLVKENIRQKTITVFDRGYYSIRLLDQMHEAGQKFLFRLKKNDLKAYANQVRLGEDKEFELSFDRLSTNEYRDDNRFRQKLMNSTYPVRICRVEIGQKPDGTAIEEILLTNLSPDEFDREALKELYRLRWEVETAYNVLKNRMKLEEFSGYRARLILQDIYCTTWLYNLIMLKLIEVNQEHEIPQNRYKHEMKRNVNASVGIIKTYFVRMIIEMEKEKNAYYLEQIDQLMIKELVPVRKDRKFNRSNTKNKSRMSYRYSY